MNLTLRVNSLKLTTILKHSVVLLAVIILNSVSHASATTAMSSHEMSGMSHSSGDRGSCATLCRTALLNRNTNDINRPDNEEDNDEPIPPFYSLSLITTVDEKEVKQKLYADAIKPPPKIPVYILYGVFRV